MFNFEKTLSKKLWVACLLSILVFSVPSFATEPQEVDPDPDFTSTTLIVDDWASFDPQALPPGRYFVVVVAADGSRRFFELQIAR